jgi:hypothetical protein
VKDLVKQTLKKNFQSFLPSLKKKPKCLIFKPKKREAELREKYEEE